MLEVLESYDNSSLLFSAFLWISALWNEEKPEDKEEAALKESKIWVQMQRLWQTTEGFKRSMQHWTQAMAVPRGLEGLLLRLAKCLVLLIKYELLRLKGLSRKLTMSLYQNSATAPKPLSEPGVWPSALWDKGKPLQQQPLQAKHAEKND